MITTSLVERTIRLRFLTLPRQAQFEYQYDCVFHHHLVDLVSSHQNNTEHQYQSILYNLLLHMYSSIDPYSSHFRMLLEVLIGNYNGYLLLTPGGYREQTRVLECLEIDNDHPSSIEHFLPLLMK